MNPLLARLALLAVFSGLSVNLMLQCGLGMRGLAVTKNVRPGILLGTAGLFLLTVLPLWLVFSFLAASLPLGFFEYILAFPAAALFYFSLEYVAFRFILKRPADGESAVGYCDALAGAALFITLNLAGGFTEAVALSMGFAAGILLSFAIIGGIRRRAMLEAVPAFLRGSPLVLISMGLLSLIFSSAALMFFRALGG